MTITLILVASAVLELLLFIVKPFWPARKALAVAALLTGAFGAGALVMWQPNVFSAVFLLLAGYRIFNLVRVVDDRLHHHYLRWAARRTSFMVLLFQLVLVAVWLCWNEWHVTGHTAWAVFAGLQAAVGAGLLLSVTRSLRRTQWQTPDVSYTDSELPTISVAIPARNETEDLQQCLQSLIASDYPKLEILVLDDCSQNKRTPEIIRNFAHDGVRFLQGHEPQENWLPKNQAYDRLADEANGQFIVFCGVDVRFEPGSIRQLVTALKSKNKRMMSILPLRHKSAYGQLSLIQAMRYWWELVPPRRQFNRPPVLSSCWIIERNALRETGGFEAVRRMIVPEAHFARELVRRADAYSFMRADATLGISSGKSVRDQQETAVRMRYPQVHRRPETVALLTLLEVTFLLAPFALTVAAFFVSIGLVAHALAAVASVTIIASYVRTVRSTHVNNRWFALMGAPLAVLSDIALLHYSMARYEFSTVDWKGRNICVPVMHAIPKLPDA
jgi:hypothetical protein